MTASFDPIAAFITDPAPPESALRFAAILLLDTLAVAAAAQPLEPGRIARDYAADFLAPGRPEHAAPLMFDGRLASIPGAAYAGATQIDNLDAHDGYNPTKGHIGCATVPALFAFAAQRPDLTTREALSLMVMAYEVSARAAIALHATVSDYHTSGAWNAVGVAALGCRVLGATRAQLREALGIAEFHGPRSQMMREIATPTMLHDGSGIGALTGAMAALLALRGFTGAPAITLEDSQVASYWADLGETWTIEANYIKPYPICRWSHAPLDALGALMRDHGLRRDDIARIEVRTFRESAALYAGMPDTTGQAQYSLAFALATLLRHGTVGPEHVSGAALRDPDVADLLPRIAVTEDARHSDRFPAARFADVTLTLTDGRILHSGDVHARGGPEAPLSDEEIAAKFHAYTLRVLGTARSEAIWTLRARMLEPGLPFSTLQELVTPPPD
ncbi:MmgE/PrpD family protein [Sulfitobacter sp. D35]|uniref:MmgE/PrpD family protein n=1 Tax=Sulfitobacter sp. D35 TaxID=3083252 RepID=UPI00296E82DC|nr:MmgE/PrpD family protein [Sulfitobacter sp. D35]MDW4499691.1 MmgE/PrpD family protein [Sulfitobacter sp. D35]